MRIKNILLTGDDGYKSLGIRLLIGFLKDKFNLKLAATLTQQSGVGGKMSLVKGGRWGKVEADGVSGIWVKGTPMDAVGCAKTFFKKTKFDLVISGINLGPNISGAVMSSGTFAAAHRALYINLAPFSLVLSWNLPSSYWFKDHNVRQELKRYHNYPGKISAKVVDLCIKNKFWNSRLLNINFPVKKAVKVKFARLLPNLEEIYPDQVKFNKDSTFSYLKTAQNKTKHTDYDSWALKNNFISITPCDPYMLDKKVYNKVKTKQFNLK
jgi:5'-nucleotidase